LHERLLKEIAPRWPQARANRGGKEFAGSNKRKTGKSSRLPWRKIPATRGSGAARSSPAGGLETLPGGAPSQNPLNPWQLVVREQGHPAIPANGSVRQRSALAIARGHSVTALAVLGATAGDPPWLNRLGGGRCLGGDQPVMGSVLVGPAAGILLAWKALPGGQARLPGESPIHEAGHSLAGLNAMNLANAGGC